MQVMDKELEVQKRGRRRLLARIAASLVLALVATGFTAVPAEAMQVFVNTVTGKHITIEVEPTDRIEDVKVKVSEKEAQSGVILPADEIALIYAHRELLDGNTLQDYNIQKDATLHLIRRYLRITANGEQVGEAQIGQTIMVQAFWEGAGSASGQAEFYVSSSSGERLLGTAALQQQETSNVYVATLEIELAENAWVSSDVPYTITASIVGDTKTTLSPSATLTVTEPSEPAPDPGEGGDVEVDPHPGDGDVSKEAEPDDPATSDSSVGEARPQPDTQQQVETLPATGDDSPLVIAVLCILGGVLVVAGVAAAKRRKQ